MEDDLVQTEEQVEIVVNFGELETSVCKMKFELQIKQT